MRPAVAAQTQLLPGGGGPKEGQSNGRLFQDPSAPTAATATIASVFLLRLRVLGRGVASGGGSRAAAGKDRVAKEPGGDGNVAGR